VRAEEQSLLAQLCPTVEIFKALSAALRLLYSGKNPFHISDSHNLPLARLGPSTAGPDVALITRGSRISHLLAKKNRSKAKGQVNPGVFICEELCT
jgi:hypothetical protein